MARCQYALRSCAALAVLLFLAGCPKVVYFDPVAIEQTTRIKAEALALMDQATEPYADHRVEVDTLRARVGRVVAREQSRANNEETIRQWGLLMAPQGHLLGGFLALWEQRSVLSAAFIDEARVLVADAFEKITGLEDGKARSPADAVLTR